MLFDHTKGDRLSVPSNTPGYSIRLNGSPNERNGIARSMSVMPGDKIDMQVFGKFIDPNTPHTNQTAWDNLAAFALDVAHAAQTVVIDGVGYTSGTLRVPPYKGVLTDPDGEGNIANANSVEIEGSATNRQAMVNEVNQDNGKGGTGDANNREYGGETSVSGNSFTSAPPGPVSDPTANSEAHIDLSNFEEDTKSDTHSHPSGTKSVNNGDGTTTNGSFRQAPSPTDVGNSGANSNYVFGRGNGTVYIYNNTGVQATIPQKYFVNPKR